MGRKLCKEVESEKEDAMKKNMLSYATGEECGGRDTRQRVYIDSFKWLVKETTFPFGMCVCVCVCVCVALSHHI